MTRGKTMSPNNIVIAYPNRVLAFLSVFKRTVAWGSESPIFAFSCACRVCVLPQDACFVPMFSGNTQQFLLSCVCPCWSIAEDEHRSSGRRIKCAMRVCVNWCAFSCCLCSSVNYFGFTSPFIHTGRRIRG